MGYKTYKGGPLKWQPTTKMSKEAHFAHRFAMFYDPGFIEIGQRAPEGYCRSIMVIFGELQVIILAQPSMNAFHRREDLYTMFKRRECPSSMYGQQYQDYMKVGRRMITLECGHALFVVSSILQSY